VQLVFYLHLVLHACVQTYPCTAEGEIFWKLNEALYKSSGPAEYGTCLAVHDMLAEKCGCGLFFYIVD
jgi:hypothetical protein